MIPLKRLWFYVMMLITLATTAFSAGAQVKAGFTATPITGCAPMLVQFADSSTGQDLLYYWDLGNGTSVSTNNPRPSTTYFNPGKYTVRLIVKNSQGVDTLIRTEYIVVNAAPVVGFSASDSTGCYPLVVSFKEFSTAGSGTIVSYEWDFGDGTLSTQQNPVHTYTTSGSFTVSLRVYNSNGCVKVFTKPSYIKTEFGVKADFSYVSGAGCSSPTPVSFTNKSTGTGVSTYKWSFGDGGTSTATNPVHNYTSNGAYTIQLIATNSSGCADTLIKTNAINMGFVKADFKAPASVCAGAAFAIENTSVPTTVAAKWFFSDGTTSTSINPSKTFSAPGTYTIKLVNDFGTCKDSITKSITIIAKPTAAFNINNSAGCLLPHTVSFQSTSSNAVSYVWNFGDNNTSTLASPSHTYTKTGSYTVRLIVTNASGCVDTLVKTEAVKIFKPKITSLNNLPVRGCIPYQVSPTATVQTAQPITSYLWDFGDGATSTSATPSHTYTVAGKYNVKLIVSTATGCADTLTMTQAVLVGTKPVPKFTATPRDVCAEHPVDFTDLTEGPTDEWLWQFGDGGTSILQNPKYHYNDTGHFNVQLIVSNFGCRDSIKINKYIHIIPPIASFDVESICGNDRLTRQFIDKSIGATTWLWDFGDGTTSNVQNPPPHNYAAPGNYLVVLKVSNGNCQHLSRVTVKVVQEKGQFTVDQSPVCRLSRVIMGVTGISTTNVRDYTWFFNGFNGPRVVTKNAPVAQTYSDPGVYNVGVIVTYLSGCKDTLKAVAPVVVNGTKVDFKAPFPGTCFSTTVNFIDSSKTHNSNTIKEWIWDFGDGKKETFTAPPFSHRYDTTGVFDVKLKVVDATGCTDSLTKKAIITITKPKASYTISDTILCPGSPLVTKNISTGLDVNYYWDFGDGTSSTEYSPTHWYIKEGAFKVTMKMIDKYGCSDSLSYKVQVFLPKAAYLMSDSFSTCPPLLVSFNNQSQNFTSYGWDFGDGGFSKLQNPKHNYTYPGTYTVKLWVKNNGGCTDTLKRTVTIQGPSGVFKYVPTEICNPSTINFKANTINTVSYVWDFNDGSTASSNEPASSHLYTSPGKFIPRMILKDALGCQVPIVGLDTIKVNTISTKIFAQNRVLCDSGSVSFFDSTTTNDAIGTFRWDFGDGNTSVERNPVHVYKNPGWYTIKMIATSAFGCTDTATIKDYIKVSNRPVVAIAGDTSACEPALLSFNGTVVVPDTSALKWSWTFGNSQVSTLQNPPAQTYQKAGSYPVTASVVNSDGCITNVTRTVNVRPKPIVDAGADLMACLNTPVSLTPSGANTYVWNTSPSLSCTNCESPLASPTSKTTYKVTGTTIYGCTNTDTVTVNVRQPFKMQVGNGDTLCLGSTFRLNASGADQYQWSPSLYLDNALSATPNAKPDSSMTYRVIGTDSNNCFSDTGFVTLNVRPLEVFILGDTSACEPANLRFAANSRYNDSSPLSWNWDFGNGVTSTVQNPPIQKFQNAGNYNIKVSVSNANGCAAVKETVAQIDPTPKVDVGGDTLICKFSPITLQATGADSYTWDFKPSLSCLNCPTPVATPELATTYAVTGRNIFGCISRDSITVRVNQPFDMRVGNGDTLCIGENCMLWASGAQTYQWSPTTFLDNPSSATTKAIPTTTTTYQVIGKDSIGCFSDTGRITVQVFPKPQIDIIGATAMNLSVGGKIQLETKNTTDIIKWVWTPASGLSCSTCPNPVATPTETTTYTVTGYNVGGCTTSDEVIVTLICSDGSIYIPNTFSPNSDGSNDVFFPRSSVNFTIKSFRVFNRWGQMVYQKNNFLSNSAADGWDGTFNGMKLVPDVYVYSMEVNCGTGAIIPVKGNVTLLK